MSKFEEVYGINVNDKTEKKGNLTYLSWAFAWAEFKKVYPKATYSVDKFDGTYCTGNDSVGYMVRTEVLADDLTYEMWLPVMDMRNNAILKPKMTEINKTIMRCLTKNLAMFGLGLYIYAGEDLPETDGTEGGSNDQPAQASTVKKPSQTPIVKPIQVKEKKQEFQPITKAELIGIYGVQAPEKTITWLEGKLGKELANFNEKDTSWARQQLEEAKAELDKKKAEERKKARLDRINDDDIPFPMED